MSQKAVIAHELKELGFNVAMPQDMPGVYQRPLESCFNGNSFIVQFLIFLILS